LIRQRTKKRAFASWNLSNFASRPKQKSARQSSDELKKVRDALNSIVRNNDLRDFTMQYNMANSALSVLTSLVEQINSIAPAPAPANSPTPTA
jgi:hypothetical protein